MTQSIIKPSTDLDRAVVHVSADGVVFNGFVVANEVCGTGSVYRDLVAIDQKVSVRRPELQILNNVLGPNTNTASQDGNMGRCGLTAYGPHSAGPVKLIVRGLRPKHRALRRRQRRAREAISQRRLADALRSRQQPSVMHAPAGKALGQRALRSGVAEQRLRLARMWKPFEAVRLRQLLELGHERRPRH